MNTLREAKVLIERGRRHYDTARPHSILGHMPAPKSVSPQVKQVGDQVKQFLGKDARVITNEAGDTIFLSKDGLRRVRFDINRPDPHLNPHSHVEMKVDGKWIKSGPIYPKDVTPK